MLLLLRVYTRVNRVALPVCFRSYDEQSLVWLKEFSHIIQLSIKQNLYDEKS